MFRSILLLSQIIFISSLFSNTFAWGDLGHAGIGEIAERNLDSRAKLWIRSVLGIDSLANAAIWPDLARSDPRYNAFSPYHYFEIPSGFTFETFPADQRAEKSAHTIISLAPAKLSLKTQSRDQKMILLRYLVHVVGDVHQPLHIGNGLDLGANLCYVKWLDPKTGLIKDKDLHHVIDEEVFAYFEKEYNEKYKPGHFSYQQLVQLLLDSQENKTMDRDSVTVAPIGTWYNESSALHQRVYPDNERVQHPSERRYCKIIDRDTGKISEINFDPESIPQLGKDYADAILPTVRQQLLKAGYRLAEVINKIAKESDFEPDFLRQDPSSWDEELLKSVELK